MIIIERSIRFDFHSIEKILNLKFFLLFISSRLIDLIIIKKRQRGSGSVRDCMSASKMKKIS